VAAAAQTNERPSLPLTIAIVTATTISSYPRSTTSILSYAE